MQCLLNSDVMNGILRTAQARSIDSLIGACPMWKESINACFKEKQPLSAQFLWKDGELRYAFCYDESEYTTELHESVDNPDERKLSALNQLDVIDEKRSTDFWSKDCDCTNNGFPLDRFETKQSIAFKRINIVAGSGVLQHLPACIQRSCESLMIAESDLTDEFSVQFMSDVLANRRLKTVNIATSDLTQRSEEEIFASLGKLKLDQLFLSREDKGFFASLQENLFKLLKAWKKHENPTFQVADVEIELYDDWVGLLFGLKSLGDYAKDFLLDYENPEIVINHASIQGLCVVVRPNFDYQYRGSQVILKKASVEIRVCRD